MSSHLTFDSQAILAFFLGEAGAELVRDSLEKVQKKEIDGYINILTLTEIYYILSRVNPKLAEEKQRNLRLYGLKIVARQWFNGGKKTSATIILYTLFVIQYLYVRSSYNKG